MKVRRSLCRHSLKTFTACALAGVAFGTWSSTAAAQAVAPGIALNRFEPSERGSEWFALDTLDIRGGFRPAIGVVGDYSYRPYILLNPDGSDHRRIIIGQAMAHVGASFVFLDRLRIGVSLPVMIGQNGSRSGGVVAGQRVVANLSDGGIGDVRVGADLRLAGEYGQPFTLALGGRIWFPTGDQQKFIGDDDLRVGPHLSAAGDVGALAYALTVGIVYRANDRPFAGHARGTETTFGAALGVRALNGKLLIGPELIGSSVVANSDAFLGARTTPLSLLGSLHYTAGDFRLGIGGGPGLSHAAGTAAFRGLASIEYVPQLKAEPVITPPSDRDGDTIIDREDACPDVSGARSDDRTLNGCPPDRDKDTVLDTEDACPDIAGVRTSDPKTNGCPSDADKDGIIDTVDACPDVPGVATDDPKTNGCPPDRDKDGVLDNVDACPDVAGVKTDDPKTNGCPSDRDKDTILDTEDACPDEAGKRNNDPKKNGCPVAYIQDRQIRITEQIKFRTGKAQIDPISDIILDAVLQVVTNHPEIQKIRVEGHTDSQGGAAMNKRLSDGRAAAVANWLTKHGVPKAKLTNVGFGLTKPVDSNETEEGRANNRRVEFHIETQAATFTETPKEGTAPKPAAPKQAPPKK